MKEHKCDKMFSPRDIKVGCHYSHEKKSHIYYCHYCGKELLIFEKDDEHKQVTQ